MNPPLPDLLQRYLAADAARDLDARHRPRGGRQAHGRRASAITGSEHVFDGATVPVA